jgi:hypothetical protein
LALMLGHSLRTIAARFGFRSLWPVHNHRDAHMPPQLKAAILTAVRPSEVDLEALTRREGEGLLSNLVAQRARLEVVLQEAMAAGSHHVCVSVERAVTENLSLVARLLGQLVQVHEVKSVSLLISADYLRLRHVITDTLRAYPDAAQAVSQALHELESEAARDIAANAKAGRPPIIDATPLEEAAPC